MAKKKIIKMVDTVPRRQECGDCYYNGNCSVELHQCMFIIQDKEKKDIS